MAKHLERDFREIHALTEEETYDFDGKTILISGGAGFLGSLFVKYFLYLNKHKLKFPCNIISLDNFLGREKTKQPEDPYLVNMDHDLIAPLGLKFHNKKIDFIINCSGCASPYYYERFPLETMDVSTIGTKNLLEVALHHNARILNFSSSEVLGTPHGEFIPTPEDYTPNVLTLDKRSCYDVTKMYIETISFVFRDQFNLDCKVVRPFNVVGYFRQDDKRVMPNFISRVLKDEEITVYAPGSQTRAFCWYGDFLAGCIKVLTKGKDILYHVGNPENEISVIDLANKVAKIAGKEELVKVVKTPLVYENEPQRRCPSVDKIREELNYQTTIDLDESINRMLEWAKQNYK